MSSQLTDNRRLHSTSQCDPDPTDHSRKHRFQVDVRGAWSKSFEERCADDKFSGSSRPKRLRLNSRTIRCELMIEDEGGSWLSGASRREICTRQSALREIENSGELRVLKRQTNPLLIAPGFGAGTSCVLWSELVSGIDGAPPRSPFRSC